MSRSIVFWIYIMAIQSNGLIYANDIKAEDSIQIVQKFSPEKLKEMKGKEFFKADHKREFRERIINILSVAFNDQSSREDSRKAMSTGMKELERMKEDKNLRPHYIMACNALISFLENLSEPDIYKKYIQMIDTPEEVYNLADAFTWLATSMEKTVKYGYSDETMKHITNRKFIFRHIYSLANINIFSNLFFEQRQFLLRMFDWCEKILSFSLIGNGPGYEDGIDWWVNDTAIFFDKARIFDAEMNKIFDRINGYLCRENLSGIVSLRKAIDSLNDFIKNVYLNKITVRNEEINPTKAMVFETCQKALINKNIAEHYLKVLEEKEGK